MNESDLPHFRFSERPNRELDDSFDGFDMNFAIQGSPYDILANAFRDLGERRWPFEMMRDLWSRTLHLTHFFTNVKQYCSQD